MTKYNIEITSEVRRWMDKKLNNEQLRRLVNKIQKLEEYPDVYGKPLRGPLAGIWENV